MDPKLLMKTGKQLCEIGAALLSSCEGMEHEEEKEGNEEGLLDSSDESVEEEMPEAEESEDDDKEKRVRLAKAKLRKGK